MSKTLNLILTGLLAMNVPSCATKKIIPEAEKPSTLTLLGFGKCVNLTDYLKKQGMWRLEMPYNDDVKSRISRVENIDGHVVITGRSIAGEPSNERLTEICFNTEYKGDLDGIINYIKIGDESKIPEAVRNR